MTCWTTSTAGAVSRRLDTRGSSPRFAMFSWSHPHRAARWRSAERMAWTLRMVLGDFPASFKVP
jgi:hypothetical protein